MSAVLDDERSELVGVPFFAFPVEVVDADVPWQDKLIMLLLYRMSGGQQFKMPSIQFISDKIGISEREVERSLQRIREAGWI